MDSLPLHPAFAHVPIGIAFILPILTALFLYLFVKKKVDSKSFLLILFLQGFMAVSINLTSARGESDERNLRKHLTKPVAKAVHIHEEKAEIFMFFAYFAIILIAGISYKNLNAIKIAMVILCQLILLYLGLNVGQSGGELIYKHGVSETLKKI